MSESPVNSFLRFFAGFVLFISLSFGITFTVNSYTTKRDTAAAAAAARVAAQALMLQIKDVKNAGADSPGTQ
jgi:hypothetical protein